MAEAVNLAPGRALDAGCGHGADTLWLSAHGWQVTAVDFSGAALAHARSMAEAAGADVARRIDWVESDLATWMAEPGHYDLVVCSYVHLAGSVEEVWGGWRTAWLREGPCSWLDIARSIPGPELPRPRQIKCKSRSRLWWLRSIPRCGSWSSQRSVRALSPAPMSMP